VKDIVSLQACSVFDSAILLFLYLRLKSARHLTYRETANENNKFVKKDLKNISGIFAQTGL